MDIARIVEDLHAHAPVGRGADRFRRPDAVLTFRPGPVPSFASVTAVRAGADTLDALVDAATRWFADRGRTDFTWFLGPSTTPTDTEERLRSRGATTLDVLTGMALDHEPPAGPDDIDVHEVGSAEDLLAARLLLATSGGGEPDDAARAQIRATNDSAWTEHEHSPDGRRVFVAAIDGTVLAAGALAFVDHGVDGGIAVLAGGATDRPARGRGLYRALVHRRWLASVEAGRSALVATATELSAPILARSGFTRVTSITVLRQQVDAALA